MPVQLIYASLSIGLQEFLAKPFMCVGQSGDQPLAILSDNQPVFYVVSPQTWRQISDSSMTSKSINTPVYEGSGRRVDFEDTISLQKNAKPDKPGRKLHHINEHQKLNKFVALSDQLLENEWDRVSRAELSAASVGILKNRLDAHVLPFFRYIPPTQVTTNVLDDFVARLTKAQLSSTTISQYLVVIRKLLKLAVRQDLLNEVPEMPKVKVVSQPRSMLTLQEYSRLAKTAWKLSRSDHQAPPLKTTDGGRERFWVAARNMRLAPDMCWIIRFMVNSFVRPGDLRQLKHKHVQICRGESVYLRLKLPETKKHDKPMVTMRPAVLVYESALRHGVACGYGQPDDYIFLPAEKDREYALAVIGFWFKWVMREAGLTETDELGRTRTLYSLRHTSIMFRLLYGQGIDMLTLARNARTSVQMIERFYASSLDGEMNVKMLQSRRTVKAK